MENNISPIVVGQIPEYLRGSSPLFVGFIETYYKYVQLRQNSVGLIQNRFLDTDIDLTREDFVSEFYTTYGEYLPIQMSMDRRNFVKLLNSVYNAKGTEKSLQLIFRALFNEDVAVSYPSEQILKTSDGRWESEKYFTLVNQYGNDPTGSVVLSFSNSFGDYTVETSHIEHIDADIARFYFKASTSVTLEDGQIVFIYDANGVMTYAGALVKSPSKLVVSVPGTSWQVGQVINIPGTLKNSIARITSVTPVGGIKNIEVLEYGYLHDQNQTITISPFKNKPTGSIFDTVSTLVSINPNVYHHVINIHDYTDGVSEDIVGISDAISNTSYFLETYATGGYGGQVVIAKSSSDSASVLTSQDTGLSITDWLNSRATITYEYENVVSTKGYFADERGQLSNQSIRTQDNYFYQAFSYLIETSRDIREYKNILNISHPAGTKRFSQLAKTVDYAFDFSSSRTLSIDVMYLLDIANIQDSIDSKFFTKSLYDAAVSVDGIDSKYFSKTLLDSVNTTDAIYSKYFNKVLLDSVTPTEVLTNTFGKLLLDSTLNTDAIYNNLSKNISVDSVSTSDIKYFNVNKYITDTALATSLDVTTKIASTYDSESYFAEKYVITEYQLSIG